MNGLVQLRLLSKSHPGPSTSSDNDEIASKAIRAVQQKNTPPGRFLEKDSDTDEYVKVDDEDRVMRKVENIISAIRRGDSTSSLSQSSGDEAMADEKSNATSQPPAESAKTAAARSKPTAALSASGRRESTAGNSDKTFSREFQWA